MVRLDVITTRGGDAGETLAAGGKRMRPLLVLLCAGRGAGVEAIRAATAIELVHMATLVHDDVLDDAPLRRGLPTVVANSGRDRAVATGDLLFSRAFAMLADDGTPRRFQDTMGDFGADVAGRGVGLAAFFFDVLHVDGDPLIDEPWMARRRVLDAVVGGAGVGQR